MGLDMYLKRGKKIPKKSELESMQILESLDVYTLNYEEIEPKIKEEFGDYIVKDYTYAHLYDGRPYYKTNIQVGYWRKANHIHKWFVDNVQNGVDDCENYIVTKENIEKLKEVCGKVVKDFEGDNGEIMEESEIAKELLPTQSGFFFGGLEYDKWYYEDTKYTLELCKNILNLFDFEHNYLMYGSSW